MSNLPDWSVWLFGVALLALFVWYFWTTAAGIIRYSRELVGFIQNWPQVRRAWADAEARSGGRYPWWFRLARVLVIIAAIALAAFVIWRLFQ